VSITHKFKGEIAFVILLLR